MDDKPPAKKFCLCFPSCKQFGTGFALFSLSFLLLNIVCHTSTTSPFYALDWGANPYVVLIFVCLSYVAYFYRKQIKEVVLKRNGETWNERKQGDDEDGELDSISLTDVTVGGVAEDNDEGANDDKSVMNTGFSIQSRVCRSRW